VLLLYKLSFIYVFFTYFIISLNAQKNLIHLKSLQSHDPEYRSILLHENKTYIGAKNQVFILDSETFEQLQVVEWKSLKRDIEQCKKFTNDINNCENYVLHMTSYNSSHLFFCGSNSINPKNAFFGIKDQKITVDYSSPEVLCSWDPNNRINTEIASSQSNETILVGTSRSEYEFGSQFQLIKKLSDGGVLRTDSQLDQALFVASFSAMDRSFGSLPMKKNYFVFDEKADEPKTTGHAARIAQVCANDVGDDTESWTSFLKLRLVCADGGHEKDLYFNLVKDMILVDGDSLYGAFSSESIKHRVSAICEFDLKDVQRAFASSRFWRVNRQHGSYEIIPLSEVPASPGKPGFCVDPSTNLTSKDLSDKFKQFVAKYSLVSEIVEAKNRNVRYNRPLFQIKEETFTSIASYEVRSLKNERSRIFFVATESGKIIKLLRNLDRVSSMIKLGQYHFSSDPIRRLIVSPETQTLYSLTQSSVNNISLSQCSSYWKLCPFCNRCRICLLIQDPSCGWSSHLQACVQHQSFDGPGSLDQHLDSLNYDVCDEVESSYNDIPAPPSGTSMILGHSLIDERIKTTWSKISLDEKVEDIGSDLTGHYERESRGRLAINNFQAPQDYGKYRCRYFFKGVNVATETYGVFSSDSNKKKDDKGSTTVSSNNGTTLDARNKNGIENGNQTIKNPTSEANMGSVKGVVLLGVVIFLVCLIVIIVAVIYIRQRKQCSKSGKSVEDPRNKNSQNGKNVEMNESREKRNLLTTDTVGDEEFSQMFKQSNNTAPPGELDETIPYMDGPVMVNDRSPSVHKSNTLSSHDMIHKKRPLLLRSPSMPASNYYVAFANKTIRCPSVREENGMLIMELPKICVQIKSSEESSNETQQEIITLPTLDNERENSSVI